MKTIVLLLALALTTQYFHAQTSFNKNSEVNSSETLNADFIDDSFYGVFVDERDGFKYNIIKIEDDYWLSQNLNFKADNSWCYEDKDSNCSKYGRLYTYGAALNACPDGWHLPSDEEWSKMSEYQEKEREGRTLTKEEKMNGFNTDLGGWKSKSGNYYNFKEIGYYWSSTIKCSDYAWYFYINSLSNEFHRNYHNVNMSFSVRCIKD